MPTTDERTEVAWEPADATTQAKPSAGSTQSTLPPGPPSHDVAIPRGTMLGDYRVEGVIGQGGMGIVLSAIHPLIGKRAAIKVLKASLCTDPTSVARFIDEARVVNQIGHPNIVDVFTFGTTPDGRSYLAMEWLQGETLRERLARSRPLMPEICDIVQPLIRALTAAHACRVVHRDLKPDNVFLVTVPGERHLVKLLDFGIAKLVRSDATSVTATATGALVGTPLYAAPEQANGSAIDHRTDIYALGGLVFEMLTGRPPFTGASAIEVIAKHLIEPPPRPSQLARVPRELDELVLAMLAKDPAARPSLAEIAEVFERVGRAPLELRESLAVTVQRPASQRRGGRRVVVIALIAAIVAVVIGSLAVYLGNSPAPIEPAPAHKLSVTPIPSDAMTPPVDALAVDAATVDAAPPARPPPRPSPPPRPAARPPATAPPPASPAISDPRLLPHS